MLDRDRFALDVEGRRHESSVLLLEGLTVTSGAFWTTVRSLLRLHQLPTMQPQAESGDGQPTTVEKLGAAWLDQNDEAGSEIANQNQQ